jgi:hypothetical protein
MQQAEAAAAGQAVWLPQQQQSHQHSQANTTPMQRWYQWTGNVCNDEHNMQHCTGSQASQQQ